jgi:hypothetical protein
MKSFFKITLSLVISTSIVNGLLAQQNSFDSLQNVRRDMRFLLENRAFPIYDVRIIQKEDWTSLYKIPEHPSIDSILTIQIEQKILSEINSRRKEFGKDTLLTADLFWIWKPYFDWIRFEDPHYKIFTQPAFDSKIYKNQLQFDRDSRNRRLPFQVLNINDTIIIYQTFECTIETTGQQFRTLRNHIIRETNDYKVTFFDDAKCGYIQVKKIFPNNNLLF